MSNIVVIAFDDMKQAGQLRAALRNMEALKEIHIDDAAIVVKDESGQVSVQDEVGRKLTRGIIAGGVLGPFILIAFPVAGLALGAGAVVGLGKLGEKGIDTNFITKVTESLQPGNSALFLHVHDANREAVEGALRPFRGKVLSSTLDPEAEQALKQALSEFE
jgi:uncharacterized membrane protein